MQLLMVPLSLAYQKLAKTIEPPPSKVNIERATAISLKQNLVFPKYLKNLESIFLEKQP